MHLYVHTYRYTYVQTNMRKCVGTCVLIYVPTSFIYTCIRTGIYTYRRTCVGTYRRTCRYTYVRTCMYTYIRTCICTYKSTCIFRYMLVASSSRGNGRDCSRRVFEEFLSTADAFLDLCALGTHGATGVGSCNIRLEEQQRTFTSGIGPLRKTRGELFPIPLELAKPFLSSTKWSKEP